MQANDDLRQPNEDGSNDLYASTNKKRKLANEEYDQETAIPAQDPPIATGSSHGFTEDILDVQHAGHIDISRAEAAANDIPDDQHAPAGTPDDTSIVVATTSQGDNITSAETGIVETHSEDAGARATPPASVQPLQKSVKSSSKGKSSDRVARELRDLLDDSTGTSFSPRGSARGGTVDVLAYDGVRRAAAVQSASAITFQALQVYMSSAPRPQMESGFKGSPTALETGGSELGLESQVDAYEDTGKSKAKAKSSGGAKKLSTTKTKNASGAAPQFAEPFDPSFTLGGKPKKSASKSKSKILEEDPNKAYTEEELAAKAAAFAKKSASSKLAWERKKAALAAFGGGVSPPPQVALDTSQNQRELSVPSRAGDAASVDGVSNDGDDMAFHPKQSKASKAKASNAKGQAKPSNKSKKKAKAASPAASDASSIPMLALHSADGTISTFDDTRANLGNSTSQAKKGSKSQLQQQQQIAPPPPMPEEEEEIDDRLYCICQDLYDSERMMIACDRCDEWYHIACIGLSEEIVARVDRFICPACEAAIGEKTTYIAPCARPECNNPVSKHSKYCSDWCGLTVAASRLELQKDQIDSVKLWKAVEGFQRQEAFVTVLLPDSSVPIADAKASAYNTEQELHSLSTSLDQLVAKRMSIEAQHSVVEYRLRYLRLALKRWQHSCAAYKEAIPVQPAKKSKTKSGASASAADGPCGFDVRLVWDDKDFADWVDSEGGRRVFASAVEEEEEADSGEVALATIGEEEEGLVCSLSRKKCDRHTGWQKMREADFEVEKSVLGRRLEDLAHKERRLRRRVEDVSDLLRWQKERPTKTLDGTVLASQISPSGDQALDPPNHEDNDSEMAVDVQVEDGDDIAA